METVMKGSIRMIKNVVGVNIDGQMAIYLKVSLKMI
jgi:hypothetical protein